MPINREKVHEFVEVFYQPTFKTFYINSVDGETFVKPVGVFVSLGITTSLKVITDIKDVIQASGEYNAKLAEISSKKVGGQFLNTLTMLDNPEQYLIVETTDDILDEEQANKELLNMKNYMNPDEDLKVLQEYAPKISKLQDLIDKLTSGNSWSTNLIKKEDGDYKIFHRYVNYKKEGDLEYRIGIFVSEKD